MYPVGPRWLVTPNRILNTQWATQLKLHLQVIIVPEWFCEFSAASTPNTGQPEASKLPTRKGTKQEADKIKTSYGKGKATWFWNLSNMVHNVKLAKL